MDNVCVAAARAIDRHLGTQGLIEALAKASGAGTVPNEGLGQRMPIDPKDLAVAGEKPVELRLVPETHVSQANITLALYAYLLRAPELREMIEGILEPSAEHYDNSMVVHLPDHDENSKGIGLSDLRKRLREIRPGVHQVDPTRKVDQTLAGVLLHQCQQAADELETGGAVFVRIHNVIRFVADILAYGGHSNTKNDLIRLLRDTIKNTGDDPLAFVKSVSLALADRFEFNPMINGLSWPKILGVAFDGSGKRVSTKPTQARHFRKGEKHPIELLTIVPAHTTMSASAF